jgi:hypothetical protein
MWVAGGAAQAALLNRPVGFLLKMKQSIVMIAPRRQQDGQRMKCLHASHHGDR